jgi:hypothetical protein
MAKKRNPDEPVRVSKDAAMMVLNVTRKEFQQLVHDGRLVPELAGSTLKFRWNAVVLLKKALQEEARILAEKLKAEQAARDKKRAEEVAAWNALSEEERIDRLARKQLAEWQAEQARADQMRAGEFKQPPQWKVEERFQELRAEAAKQKA